MDMENKGRRKSLGGTSTAVAARVEPSVDPIRNDRPPLAQVAIGQCASEGFGVTPDRERELVAVRLAVLTLPWVVIGGREDLACPSRRHDRVGRATGKQMDENGPLANTYPQAGLPTCVRRAPAERQRAVRGKS